MSAKFIYALLWHYRSLRFISLFLFVAHIYGVCWQPALYAIYELLRFATRRESTGKGKRFGDAVTWWRGATETTRCRSSSIEWITDMRATVISPKNTCHHWRCSQYTALSAISSQYTPSDVHVSMKLKIAAVVVSFRFIMSASFALFCYAALSLHDTVHEVTEIFI